MPGGEFTVAPGVEPGQGRTAHDRWGQEQSVTFDQNGRPLNQGSFGERNTRAAGRDVGEAGNAALRVLDSSGKSEKNSK